MLDQFSFQTLVWDNSPLKFSVYYSKTGSFSGEEVLLGDGDVSTDKQNFQKHELKFHDMIVYPSETLSVRVYFFNLPQNNYSALFIGGGESYGTEFWGSIQNVIDCRGEVTWDGKGWSTIQAPQTDQKLIVKGDLKVVENLVVCSCEVDSGKLYVKSGKILTVKGSIANNTSDSSSVVVESGANLIQLQDDAVNTGKITVQRDVSDVTNVINGTQGYDYVYWGAPVTGQNIREFSPGTPWNRRYEYRESDDMFTPTSDAEFKPGKGYALRAEVGQEDTSTPAYSKTYKFKGVPNNGQISVTLKKSANTVSGGTTYTHGFNLIANPYPSNIDFDELYNLNSDVIYKSAWLWTNNNNQIYMEGSTYNGNNYAVFTGTGGIPATFSNSGKDDVTVPNGVISVGQSFIVQVKRGVGEYNFHFANKSKDGSMIRVGDKGHFYQRSTSSAKNRFWLELVSPSQIINTQLIGYMDGATDDYDQDFDSEAFGVSSDLFYSVLDDRKLLIQGKANSFKTEDVVSLGANIFSSGEYIIRLKHPEGIFESDQNIYLKDLLLNTNTNLKDDEYRFIAEPGLIEGRFQIVYENEATLAVQETLGDAVQVFRSGEQFIVRSSTTKIDEVEMYDINGRLIHQSKVDGFEISLNGSAIPNGIYILKIKQADHFTTRKIRK